ncbi:MAG: hypothetical protein ACI4XF_02020, partial [Oscillospiraceae bacterium]
NKIMLENPHAYPMWTGSQKSSGYGLKILRDMAMQYYGSFDIEIADGVCTAVIAIVTDICDIKETNIKCSA